MIQRIRVRSVRCIRDIDLTLEPLTALLGPNGSGKSTVLAALNPATALGAPDDSWQRLGARPERSFWIDSKNPVVAHGGMGLPQDLLVLRVQPLRLVLEEMRRPVTLEPAPTLSADGANFSNVFGSLTRVQKANLAEQLCALVPLFRDVDSVPVGNGYHQMRYQDRWNHDVWYTLGQVSDGTILLTAFLTLQFQNPPVGLITIEEPERGLHPYLLEQLVTFLRKLSRGEIGRAPIQVVLATHSPDLLQYLHPKEVRFLDRDPSDGSTTVRAIPENDPDWPRYFKEYGESLREAWLSGGLGGVPGMQPGA